MSRRDGLAQVDQRDAQLTRVEVVGGGRLEAALARLHHHVVLSDRRARHEQLVPARRALERRRLAVCAPREIRTNEHMATWNSL